MKMKQCTACGVNRPVADYYRNGPNGWHTSCKECQKARAKRWREENIVRAKLADAEKHRRNREQRIEAMRIYDDRNASSKLERMRVRYAAKADAIKAANAAYRVANPEKVRVWNGKRRAVEARATPKWADADVMASLYALSAIYSKELGETFHVDHVIPLRGRNVCGLHVQDNLQVIPASLNLRKGARFE